MSAASLLAAAVLVVPAGTQEAGPITRTQEAGSTTGTQEAGPTTGTIVEIRVHGNHSIPDQELLGIAGVAEGDRLEPGILEAVERRLLASGRVESVEIRTRYRSLSDTHRVALILLVKEKVPVRDKVLVAPIFNWTDEYGVTFGGRFTFLDLAGMDERISVPLSWGGERQAAVEMSRRFESGPLDLLEAGFGVRQRDNPHFEIADRRTRAWVRALRGFGPLAVDAGVSWADVDFGELGAPTLRWGTGIALDTRRERDLPRDAFYAGARWSRLDLLEGGPAFDLVTLDLRGYKAFIGRSVLAAQVRWEGADGRLPDWERPFLGGAATLRGHDAGELVGDNRALGALEWRLPVTPPLEVGEAGVLLFFDTGAVYDHGTALGDARFHHGVGAGAWLDAALLGLKIDVGWDLADAVRVHFSTGVRF